MYVSLETFKHSNKDLPDWYDELVHAQFISRYLANDKLQAVKFLREVAKAQGKANESWYDLKWCKDKVEDLIILIKSAKGEHEAYSLDVIEYAHDPVLVTKVVEKVLDLKYINGREQILATLIKYVHPKILEDYLNNM